MARGGPDPNRSVVGCHTLVGPQIIQRPGDHPRLHQVPNLDVVVVLVLLDHTPTLRAHLPFQRSLVRFVAHVVEQCLEVLAEIEIRTGGVTP